MNIITCLTSTNVLNFKLHFKFNRKWYYRATETNTTEIGFEPETCTIDGLLELSIHVWYSFVL